MLRVVAGEYSGRLLKAPPSGITRAVTDKIRAAIFSTLGELAQGADVLDLFAGSGALGLEAISRGAGKASFVEKNKKAWMIVKDNIAALGLKNQTTLYLMPAETFLKGNGHNFNIILLDPPYAQFDPRLIPMAKQLLKKGGVIVVSCSTKTVLADKIGVATKIKHKIYGDTQIAYYH